MEAPRLDFVKVSSTWQLQHHTQLIPCLKATHPQMPFLRLQHARWCTANMGGFRGHWGQMLKGSCPLCPAVCSLASVIVPCGLGGWTDGPSCCLLFSQSANESPDAAQSQSNESSRVWARIESWVVQSVRRTTISSECTGWMHVGDGNVTHLFQYQMLQM